jgi:hypothetical protein
VRNPDASDGLWRIEDKRQVVYAKRELSRRDQIEAARALTEQSREPPSPEEKVVRLRRQVNSNARKKPSEQR